MEYKKIDKSCALVLAAGFSRRFGSDKRFVGKKEPLILQSLQGILEVFNKIYLVHRNEDDKLKQLLKDLPIVFIPALAKDICLSSSISCGIKYILKQTYSYESCALFLADMPFIKVKTINSLLFEAKRDLIIRPKYKQQLGHPVIFGNKFFKELISLKYKNGAREVICKNIESLKIIKINDKGVVQDIDYNK